MLKLKILEGVGEKFQSAPPSASANGIALRRKGMKVTKNHLKNCNDLHQVEVRKTYKFWNKPYLDAGPHYHY